MEAESLARLRAQLDLNLGRRRFVAADGFGHLVIGDGRSIQSDRRDHRPGVGLHDDEIDVMRDRDIALRSADVLRLLPWTAQLDDARFGVLVELAVSPGAGWMSEFVACLASLRAGNYAGAARHLAAYPWPTAELERARRLAQQLHTGSWQA